MNSFTQKYQKFFTEITVEQILDSDFIRNFYIQRQENLHVNELSTSVISGIFSGSMVSPISIFLNRTKEINNIINKNDNIIDNILNSNEKKYCIDGNQRISDIINFIDNNINMKVNSDNIHKGYFANLFISNRFFREDFDFKEVFYFDDLSEESQNLFFKLKLPVVFVVSNEEWNEEKMFKEMECLFNSLNNSLPVDKSKKNVFLINNIEDKKIISNISGKNVLKNKYKSNNLLNSSLILMQSITYFILFKDKDFNCPAVISTNKHAKVFTELINNADYNYAYKEGYQIIDRFLTFMYENDIEMGTFEKYFRKLEKESNSKYRTIIGLKYTQLLIPAFLAYYYDKGKIKNKVDMLNFIDRLYLRIEYVGDNILVNKRYNFRFEKEDKTKISIAYSLVNSTWAHFGNNLIIFDNAYFDLSYEII